MDSTSFVRTAGALALALVGLSTVCSAGGRPGGPVLHGVGFHGRPHAAALGGWHGWGSFRLPHRVLSLSAGVRVPTAGTFFTRHGRIGTAMTNAVPPDGLSRPIRGGHTEDGRFVRNGGIFGRDRRFPSYAFAPRGWYRPGPVLPGYIGAGGYGYGDDVGSGPSYSTAPGYGYAEPPLAATFAEAPLGPSPYSGKDGVDLDDQNADSAPSAGYGGGPQVIVIDTEERSPKSQGRSDSLTPVVYRFGVGSYY